MYKNYSNKFAQVNLFPHIYQILVHLRAKRDNQNYESIKVLLRVFYMVVVFQDVLKLMECLKKT